MSQLAWWSTYRTFLITGTLGFFVGLMSGRAAEGCVRVGKPSAPSCLIVYFSWRQGLGFLRTLPCRSELGSFEHSSVLGSWRLPRVAGVGVAQLAGGWQKHMPHQSAFVSVVGPPENKFSVAFETSGVSNQERERQCIAYWRRGLAAVTGQKFFSWGCDASRVGFKGRTATLVALP
jgi:hypothetical protein